MRKGVRADASLGLKETGRTAINYPARLLAQPGDNFPEASVYQSGKPMLPVTLNQKFSLRPNWNWRGSKAAVERLR
jgi:hypothetical protein